MCRHMFICVWAIPQATKATEKTWVGIKIYVSVGRLLLTYNIQVRFSYPDKEDRLLETVQGTSDMSHLPKRHHENPEWHRTHFCEPESSMGAGILETVALLRDGSWDRTGVSGCGKGSDIFLGNMLFKVVSKSRIWWLSKWHSSEWYICLDSKWLPLFTSFLLVTF